MSLTKFAPTERPDLPPIDLSAFSGADMRAIVMRELRRRFLISVGNTGQRRTEEQRRRISEGRRAANARRKAEAAEAGIVSTGM